MSGRLDIPLSAFLLLILDTGILCVTCDTLRAKLRSLRDTKRLCYILEMNREKYEHATERLRNAHSSVLRLLFHNRRGAFDTARARIPGLPPGG